MTDQNNTENKDLPDIANTTFIDPSKLIEKVSEMWDRDMRFITATCLDRGDRFEINYHFDKDLCLEHIRTFVKKEDEIPSITGVYKCAFLVENEIEEFFGAKFKGLHVNFQGKMFLCSDSPKNPMIKK